jgi:hypothetical protein
MGKGGWSWKRATGITKLKRSVSKTTGIPLTKGGRQRKVGRAVGCNTVIFLVVGISAVITWLL